MPSVKECLHKECPYLGEEHQVTSAGWRVIKLYLYGEPLIPGNMRRCPDEIYKVL